MRGNARATVACFTPRVFNAHHDEYGFQPIVVFDDEGRMIAAVLRPASRPSGKQIVRWQPPSDYRNPRQLAAGGDYVACRQPSLHPRGAASFGDKRLDYTLGVAPTSTLRKHVLSLEESTAGSVAPLRMGPSYDGSRFSTTVRPVGTGWNASSLGWRPDLKGPMRFIVTSLNGPSGRTIYQEIYCARDQTETTSRHGKRIWPRTAHPSFGRQLIRCDCSCMSARIGRCGAYAR
jgi:hypothetical protein